MAPKNKRPSVQARKLLEQIERNKQEKLRILKRDTEIVARKQTEIDEKWRKILMQLKQDEERNQVRASWQAFSRACDTKNGIIQLILKLFKQSDDQYDRGVHHFLKTFETEIHSFLRNMDELAKTNEYRVAETIKNGNEEYKGLVARFQYDQHHLKLATFYGHQRFLESVDNTRGDILVKISDDMNKTEELLDSMVSMLEDDYNQLWEDFKSYLKKYFNNTAEINKKTRVLRTRVVSLINTIEEQTQKMIQLEASISNLNKELELVISKNSKNDLIRRREKFRIAWKGLKKKLEYEQDVDRKNIQLLVIESNEACFRILQSERTCQKIIKMIALCRKHESLREKVLPIGAPKKGVIEKSETISVRVALKRLLHTSQSLMSTTGIQNAICATYDYKTLMYRVGKVTLICKALKREKRLLLDENAMICEELSRHRGSDILSPVTSECVCLLPGECRTPSLPSITNLKSIMSKKDNKRKS